MTVEELWRRFLPPGTSLLAGERGLARQVTWPIVARARAPLFERLQGGEIALLTVDGIRQVSGIAATARLMASLADLGVSAALIVGHPPAEALQVASERGLPLLRLPDGTALPDLAGSLARAIAESQEAMHRWSRELGQQLNTLAIAGQGLSAILRKLAAAVERPVCFETVDGVLQCSQPWGGHGAGEAWLEQALAAARPALHAECWDDPAVDGCATLPLGEGERLVAKVDGSDGPAGFLSLLGVGRSFTPRDRAALLAGAAACAIEIARERAALEARKEHEDQWLRDLLRGEDVEAALERGRQLGHTLSGAYVSLALRPHPPLDRGTLHERLAALAADGRAERGAPYVYLWERQATLLCPLNGRHDEHEARRLGASLHRALVDALDTPLVTVGVGTVARSPREIPRTYQEAEQALDLAERVFGRGRIVYFGDLGVYRLLSRLDQVELRRFHEERLGPLLQYDRQHRTELVKTLDAFLAANNSPTAAAERLHLHRNSLLYRLGRIEEILGVSLEDPEQRLALHLALRAREVLGDERG